MSQTSLGANEFSFSGCNTDITYFPNGHGPIVVGQGGSELRYSGPEGDFTFSGSQITAADTALGRLVSVSFPSPPDVGVTTMSLPVPTAIGVTGNAPVDFATVAIKAHHRGFKVGPGVEQTYDVLPLVGKAMEVVLPL